MQTLVYENYNKFIGVWFGGQVCNFTVQEKMLPALVDSPTDEISVQLNINDHNMKWSINLPQTIVNRYLLRALTFFTLSSFGIQDSGHK